MRLPKEEKLMPVGARLNKDLVNKVQKKMIIDKKKGRKITWRALWESSMIRYLNTKSR